MSGLCPRCCGFGLIQLSTCPDCEGKRVVAHEPYCCPKCGGRGSRKEFVDWDTSVRPFVPRTRERQCEMCAGSGLIDDERQQKILSGMELREKRSTLGIRPEEEANRRGISVAELERLEAGED